ncbi:MAG: ATP phosphoribosyltransferase regulatory subunit [Pseudomonadota bacterium]
MTGTDSTEGADRWLLPLGVEDLLPDEARELDRLQRVVTDLFERWGYDLVIPPYLDYLDSLLTGTSRDLDIQTFKLIDQSSGRLLGLRADMTPQVARIDAHHMRETSTPVRLCYVGPVFRALAGRYGTSRTPQQAGAEIYGHRGAASDAEVLALLVETVRAARLDEVHLDIGHVGVFKGLIEAGGVPASLESQLFEALQRKATSELQTLVADLPTELGQAFITLAGLNGGADVLEEAQRLLPQHPQIEAAIAELRSLWAMLESREVPGAIQFDLAELRGYRYHAGIVFAAFVPGHGQEVARGGRYDEIGEAFGRSRPATGFSTDLRLLAMLNRTRRAPGVPRGIFAPYDERDAEGAPRQVRIRELRAAGERVVEGFPGEAFSPAQFGCDRQLICRNGEWRLEPTSDGDK